MSQWTSKCAISRDLSMVQGLVPVEIDRIITADDKPPAFDLTEETEEEFFRHCTGEGDYNAVPDLGLIKQMLDIVRDKNISSDEEDQPENIVVISKLNPPSDEFVSQTKKTDNLGHHGQTTSKKQKTRKVGRNMAIASLLKAKEDEKDENRHANVQIPVDNSLKLLKPNDLISNDPEITKSVDKVNGWLESQRNNLPPCSSPDKQLVTLNQTTLSLKKPTLSLNKLTLSPNKPTSSLNKPSTVTLEPTNMFKKRAPVNKADKIEDIKVTVTKVNNNNIGEAYKPSELADEYYNKYLERVQLKEAMQDDIWTKAEKKMKEIEAKIKLEAAQSQSSATSARGTDVDQKLDIVRLPQHRHLLTGSCTVCEIMNKHGLHADIDV